MSGVEPDDSGCEGGANADDSYEVELDHQGETISVTVDEDQPVLDAAEDNGLDLPYSCREGQCTSCVGKLIEGDLDQSRGTALDPMQKEDGFALLCVACPESDCRIETDAQDDMFGMDIR
jgi:ferredoxin